MGNCVHYPMKTSIEELLVSVGMIAFLPFHRPLEILMQFFQIVLAGLFVHFQGSHGIGNLNGVISGAFFFKNAVVLLELRQIAVALFVKAGGQFEKKKSRRDEFQNLCSSRKNNINESRRICRCFRSLKVRNAGKTQPFPPVRHNKRERNRSSFPTKSVNQTVIIKRQRRAQDFFNLFSEIPNFSLFVFLVDQTIFFDFYCWRFVFGFQVSNSGCYNFC